MPIITDLAPPQTAEGFILDPNGSSPLNLGNGGSLQLSALTIPPPPKRPEWASNGDVDGAALVRIPYHDNRECSFKVRCMDGTMDQAIVAIGMLEGKLQEACIQGAGGGDGLPFLWTPSHASTGLTGYMVFAQITDLPVTYDDGWFAQHPVLTVAFTCKPFLYGAEVTGPTATGTAPMLTVAVPSVPGDVPAEARLVITDGSSQARRWVEWGLEQKNYNAAFPAPLLIDSESMPTSGFAGILATQAGGYRSAGATHDTVSANLLAQPVAVCGTGSLSHIGTFRVKARVYTISSGQYWRLTWQVGDGPFQSTPWVQPLAAADYSEIDFGTITVEQVEAGSQQWSGRFEAYTTAVVGGGDVGEIDYLMLFPVDEGYGRLEASYSYTTGVVSAHDDFGSAAGALNGRTSDTGDIWATTGATTDFTAATDPLNATNKVESRATAVNEGISPRIATLGSSTYTDCEVSVNVYFAGSDPFDKFAYVVSRYVNTGNFAFARVVSFSATQGRLAFGTYIGGSLATIGAEVFTLPTGYFTIRLVAFASGHAIASVLDSNGATLASVEVFLSALATGGTLASGKAGFADLSTDTVALTRYYDAFRAGIPSTEPLIINLGESLQVRSDSNLRQAAGGATYGDIPSRGSRLFIPQAGAAGRTSRIAVRAVREDPVTQASRNDGDSLTLSVFYTPRYLAVPR